MIHSLETIQNILNANRLGWFDDMKTADCEEAVRCFRSDEVSIGTGCNDFIVYARGKSHFSTTKKLNTIFAHTNVRVVDMGATKAVGFDLSD